MTKKMLTGLLLFLVLNTNSFAGGGFPHVVFEAQDFGPPSMSHDLLNAAVYSWGGVYEDVSYVFNIDVIVYRGQKIHLAKMFYPVVKVRDKEQDYRYITFDEAISYLNRNIKENVIEETTSYLIKVREKLIKELGTGQAPK